MNYSTGINWELFFKQVDLVYNDSPLYIKNFLPTPSNFISWKDVNNILNNTDLKWSIIEDSKDIFIPTYNSFTNKNFQDKKFISHHINKGNTFIIQEYITYNEYTKTLLNEIESYFRVASGSHIFGSKNVGSTNSYLPHIDEDPLFIFNIEGKTKWNLFSNKVSNLLEREEINDKIDYKRLTPNFTQILSPGDFLYIPQRTFHSATPIMDSPYRLSLNVSNFLSKVNFRIDKNYYNV